MRRLSGITTPILKFGWLVPCAIALVVVFASPRSGVGSSLPLVLPVLLIAAIGTWLQTTGLADAVYDNGDSLLVRYRGIEESIPFAAINAVEECLWLQPRTVTVRFKEPRRIGTCVRFVVAFDPSMIIPVIGSQVARDLRWRCGLAKYR